MCSSESWSASIRMLSGYLVSGAQASISSLFATNGFISSVFRNLSYSAKTREGGLFEGGGLL